MGNVTAAKRYAREVAGGKRSAGKYVRLAAERFLADLSSKGGKYAFDAKAAARACQFIERLPHTKGQWAQRGENLKLQPWQSFIVCNLFGWKNKQTGLRRYREAYIEVPRKNGKTILAAGIGLYMLVADGEYGAEVYSGATTEKQAWEIFRPAKLMVKRRPEMQSYFGVEVNAKTIYVPSDGSRFEPVIGNPGDGASPSCALVDEYHEHDRPDLFDTMQTGMGSRQQPLMFVITTAGSNMAGPCYAKRGEVLRILEGVYQAPEVFGLVYGLDEGDDWAHKRSWKKANPNLGVSLAPEFIEAQVAAAQRTPEKQNAVLTKHFNQWVGARQAWLNMLTWAAAGDKALRLDDFADAECFVGIDLATRVDMAARVSVYTRQIDGAKHYYFFPHFYLPEDALQDARNAKQYRAWATAGYIDLMDGAEIGFAQIESDLVELAAQQRVREFVYDPWQATQIAQALREKRLEAVEYRNTVANLSPPMRELEAALRAGRIHHTDNPVFNWMVSNVVAKEDAKANIFPRKERPENKIDGAMAALFAMGRAMHSTPEQHAYKLRGFTTL